LGNLPGWATRGGGSGGVGHPQPPPRRSDSGRRTGRAGERGPFNGNNSIFSNASSHSRITNAFSDIGRPRSCALARFGTIRLRAQAEIASARRSDTPTPGSCTEWTREFLPSRPRLDRASLPMGQARSVQQLLAVFRLEMV